MFHFLITNKEAGRRRGFSLVEMLVSIAILVIVVTVLLISYSRFGDNILLTNLAYDIALTLREAQSYGISTREFSPGEFGAGYGIRFASGSNRNFILFADKPNLQGNRDGKCPGSSLDNCEVSDEFVKKFEIGGRNRISKFCAKPPSGTEECYNFTTGIGGLLSFLDIVFTRPEPDAAFKTNLGNGYKLARIYVTAPGGASKFVEVGVTGQISVR